MSKSSRGVTNAMGQERPEKITIRNLWLDLVKSIAEKIPNPEYPWYLTLSGELGLDIQSIIDEGLIKLTETNSISEEDQKKLVAVERSNRAVLSLQKTFVGLRIKEYDFRDLVRGEGILSWPEGDDRKVCRAHIVNLDLNEPLVAKIEEGNIIFPVIVWIKKLCHIHADQKLQNWRLCLTLNGSIDWDEPINQWINDFIHNNIGMDSNFAELCETFLGKEIYSLFSEKEPPNFSNWDRNDKQKLLMVVVPKMISRENYNDGWEINTLNNYFYGEEPNAPMVTWILDFNLQPDNTSRPNILYQNSIRRIFDQVGFINTDGDIENLN